jgi:hypothetical protein
MGLQPVSESVEDLKAKFKVFTELTGRHRRIGIFVHATKESFDEAKGEDDKATKRTKKQMPHRDWSDETIAFTLSNKNYILNDMMAQLHFRTDIPLTYDTVVHEVTHAAISMYYMDFIHDEDQLGKKPQKARKHMSLNNEVLPRLTGELTSDILKKLKKKGIEVVN